MKSTGVRLARGVALLALGLSLPAFAAESSVPLLSVTPGAGGQIIGVPGASLPWLLLFPFLPALLLAFTAFTRIAVVLFLLRQGLGSQTAPPNLVLMGLAVLLTIFVMSPALKTINAEAYQPYLAGSLSFNAAAEQAAEPLKSFMLRQTRAEDLSLFLENSGAGGKPIDPASVDPRQIDSVPLAALAPAFLTSELKTAFQIGFMVILPFLVIDLVVAAVLTALGMIMLPPQLVSLPLKLLLFVSVDGWHLLVGSLIGSF
ncbi:flagellar type III secretion system pore protein FliP [Thiobacillus sp.]|uniref:flagellar type III secretion system pore protein FliP n=1 Tax=Thiobacillus sp. TaxID=924 RepID=UPI00286E0602|nr:flagellar type III secretion system pore protein FliP [Thiobacillus sp.]